MYFQNLEVVLTSHIVHGFKQMLSPFPNLNVVIEKIYCQCLSLLLLCFDVDTAEEVMLNGCQIDVQHICWSYVLVQVMGLD